MNDLIEKLENSKLGVVVLNIQNATRFYCDDITLYADCPRKMAKLLQICERHAQEWCYQFNEDKCEILIYDQGKHEFKNKIPQKEINKELQQYAKNKNQKLITSYFKSKRIQENSMKMPQTIYKKHTQPKFWVVKLVNKQKKSIIHEKHIPKFLIEIWKKRQTIKHIREPYTHIWDCNIKKI